MVLYNVPINHHYDNIREYYIVKACSMDLGCNELSGLLNDLRCRPSRITITQTQQSSLELKAKSKSSNVTLLQAYLSAVFHLS